MLTRRHSFLVSKAANCGLRPRIEGADTVGVCKLDVSTLLPPAALAKAIFVRILRSNRPGLGQRRRPCRARLSRPQLPQSKELGFSFRVGGWGSKGFGVQYVFMTTVV